MVKSKPWTLVDWKIRRREFLQGKTCEWCGSKENLSIHHTKEGITYREFAYHFYLEYFENGKHAEELEAIKRRISEDGFQPKYSSVCPKCRYSAQERKRKKPRYRCFRCNFDFDDPIVRMSPESSAYLRTLVYRYFKKQHEEEMQALFKPIRERNNEDYMNFKNVIVLCRRCHFAISNGMRLCPSCHKKYTKYELCFDCFKKTEKGKKWMKSQKELKELEEEDMKFDQEIMDEHSDWDRAPHRSSMKRA